MSAAPSTPSYANGFNMVANTGVTILTLAYSEPGVPFESSPKVGHLAMNTPFARQMALMILAETDPKKLEAQEIALAAQRTRAADEANRRAQNVAARAGGTTDPTLQPSPGPAVVDGPVADLSPSSTEAGPDAPEAPSA